MRRQIVNELRISATEGDGPCAVEAELNALKDALMLLPAGVTVQDEDGNLLLVNDVAAAQLGVSQSEAAEPSPQLIQRRSQGLELLLAGRAAVTEESTGDGQLKQVLLTSHRPVRIDGRNLLLSCSADISEQKAFEDQLFRSAYYDELTDLPSRRVIEHRVNGLLQRSAANEKFALAFQFQAYQRLLRPRSWRCAADRACQAAGARVARNRHAVADFRR